MKYMKFWRLVPAVMLVCSSCADYLTLEPDNRTVEEGYYESARRVEQAVIGCYVDLRRALLSNHAWLMYGEARAGDLLVEAAYSPYVVNQALTAPDYQLIRLTDWGYFYDAIKRANDVLDIVDAADAAVLSADQRNLYRGEALAVKSLTYFYLARIWGDVPSAEADDFGQRISAVEAVERAAVWAREAQGLLPWRLMNNDGIESAALTAIRFNKTAATLLLAQEELWQGRGREAHNLLEQTFTADNVDSLAGFGLSMGTDRRVDIPNAPLSGSMVRMSLDRLNAIYPEGDARRTNLLTISATQGAATLIVPDQTVLELLKLAELPLLQAEAAWRAGFLDKARNHLVTAAQGATEDYINLPAQAFADALLLERQRLLVGTGQRFFDLMRFGQVSRNIPALDELAVQNGAAYWPVSARGISGNSWSQNSYWSR
ncbi:RagB/SusD family nutrient uptake outer membrane protein [Parapedobacter deserti]|uniref:RagB/SusD family nutrient uptake outer membrane protein n=1 Tax=Parapedobacter deserti TaxID=1912957 RepID=A0ABV7JR04_9SPHI